VKDAIGRPVPGLASAAKQMGNYVGKLTAARVAGQSLPPFRYRHEGSLATIGRRAAVVELGPI
jgi:NADH:ubiquinone reductase (H+-translocating)